MLRLAQARQSDGFRSCAFNEASPFPITGVEIRLTSKGNGSEGPLRGGNAKLGRMSAGPGMENGRHTAELGISPAEKALGTVTFGDETNFYAGYREWRRLMERAAKAII